MRFTFPHFTPEPEFIQPDYDKWTAVRVGMSRDETTALLGPPLDDRYRGGKSSPTDPYYSYGFLQMPMVPHPRTYAFLIGFGSDGKVFTKMDPFNGRFSVDGSPTVPEIIIPADETVFSHYPVLGSIPSLTPSNSVSKKTVGTDTSMRHWTAICLSPSS
jgi:hypothetical protein